MTLYCYVQNLWTQLLLINSVLSGERLWLKSLLTGQGNLLAREENELKIQMVRRSPRKEPPAVGTVQKRQSQGWKQIQKMKGIPGAKLGLRMSPAYLVTDFNTPPTHAQSARPHWNIMRPTTWTVSRKFRKVREQVLHACLPMSNAGTETASNA